MIGGLAAARRVAAVALLALGSTAPLNAPVRAATVAPVADTSAACAVTVGTATTDPAFAADAARAIAVGYTPTDCLPDVQLLAAAEARAAIPMGSTTTPTMASSPLGGSRSSGRVAAAPTTTSSPTTTTPPTTDTPTPTPTETSTTETSSTENDSNDGSPSGTESNGSNNGLSNEPTNNGNAGCVDTGSAAAANVAVANGTATDATTDGTGTTTGDAATNNTAADGATTSAACALSWGAATGVEDFDDARLTNWSRYDGPGHAGEGIRAPEAMSVNGGVLTITGDSNGTTGGMAWQLGRSKYGRWEARVKSPVADPSYNAVMLLWPDDIEWPTGGEVDFMEIGDETRQEVDFFLHYSSENRQLYGSKKIDATQWHNWAVEWSPTKITGYVDGVEWFSTTQASALPPGSMHLTLQLDWFPKGGSVQQSAMHVDWVRYYPIDGSGAPGEIVNSPGTTSDTGVTVSRSGSTDAGGGSGTTEDEGTDDAAEDDADDADDSVAGATSTTTVTITPESEPTTTIPESDPTTGGDSAGEDTDGTDGADGTGTETGTTDQNGDDADPGTA